MPGDSLRVSPFGGCRNDESLAGIGVWLIGNERPHGSGCKLSTRKDAKAKKRPKYNLGTRLRSALRDVWRRSPAPQALLKEKRVAPNTWLCSACGGRFNRKEIRIDHIEPVVAVTGFVDWNTYVERMFCGTGGLQLMCLRCHDVKCVDERRARKEAANKES